MPTLIDRRGLALGTSPVTSKENHTLIADSFAAVAVPQGWTTHLNVDSTGATSIARVFKAPVKSGINAATYYADIMCFYSTTGNRPIQTWISDVFSGSGASASSAVFALQPNNNGSGQHILRSLNSDGSHTSGNSWPFAYGSVYPQSSADYPAVSDLIVPATNTSQIITIAYEDGGVVQIVNNNGNFVGGCYVGPYTSDLTAAEDPSPICIMNFSAGAQTDHFGAGAGTRASTLRHPKLSGSGHYLTHGIIPPANFYSLGAASHMLAGGHLMSRQFVSDLYGKDGRAISGPMPILTNAAVATGGSIVTRDVYAQRLGVKRGSLDHIRFMSLPSGTVAGDTVTADGRIWMIVTWGNTGTAVPPVAMLVDAGAA